MNCEFLINYHRNVSTSALDVFAEPPAKNFGFQGFVVILQAGRLRYVRRAWREATCMVHVAWEPVRETEPGSD